MAKEKSIKLSEVLLAYSKALMKGDKKEAKKIANGTSKIYPKKKK